MLALSQDLKGLTNGKDDQEIVIRIKFSSTLSPKRETAFNLGPWDLFNPHRRLLPTKPISSRYQQRVITDHFEVTLQRAVERIQL